MTAAASLAIYNVLLALLAIAGWPLLAIAVLRSPRLRKDFGERLRPLPLSAEPTIWVHAASVGEVETAVPLVRALRARGTPLVLTALSTTGRERLRAHFADLAPRLAPLDLPLLCGLGVRRARVRTLVLIETELWPNSIAAVKRSGGTVLIASGRLSDAGFARYRRLRAWLAPLLATIDAVAARSEIDRARFVALGVPSARARVLGDLKLDAPAPPEPSSELRAALGSGPLLLCASTHPGEEQLLLSAWLEVRARAAPSLRLVLVPRHPERAPEVLALARAAGAKAGLRSQGAAHAEVVVVDTLGELRALYALADLVVAGGTFATIGGHNLIEATLAGRILIAGPHLQNQRDQAGLLAPLGALRTVVRPADLAPALIVLWDEPDRHAAARTAREVIAESRGASARIIEWLDGLEGERIGRR